MVCADAPLVFRGCIDNAPAVRQALAQGTREVFVVDNNNGEPSRRELWHLGLGWSQAAVDARAACAHVFAELYRVPEEELLCCAGGLSLLADDNHEDDNEGGWRGYLALADDDDVAAGDLVLWRRRAPSRLPRATSLPVEMRPRADVTPLALARLRRAFSERRCARFVRGGGVEVLRFAPRVHGVGGARRVRMLRPHVEPLRLCERTRRLFGVL